MDFLAAIKSSPVFAASADVLPTASRVVVQVRGLRRSRIYETYGHTTTECGLADAVRRLRDMQVRADSGWYPMLSEQDITAIMGAGEDEETA